MPQKLADGSITYFYANGALVNNNAATGTYYMAVPSGDGGQTIYQRTGNDATGYTVRQISTNGQGVVTYDFTGKQATRDGAVVETGLTTVDQNGNVTTTRTDANGDGRWDDIKTATRLSSAASVVKEDTNGDGVTDRNWVMNNGQLYDLGKTGDAIFADSLLAKYFAGGILDSASYLSLSQIISNTLTGGSTGSGQCLAPADFYNPIGAFYEVKSAALDTAASIAAKTPVLLDAQKKGMATVALQNLDANKDGKLAGAELAGLQVWVDANEDGIGDGGEFKTLAQTGITEIRATDYGFYTRGNSRYAAAVAVAPVKTGVAAGVPSSNYRSLRDTDNYYWINSYQYIAFGASQVKINNGNRTYLIGTDSNDRFDANYYAAYSQYFNSNLLVNFLAGGGDDIVGGSARNDNIWGGTGNDVLFGYVGDDKLYGEEGNDELQGGVGNDTLDGGIGNDKLFGQVGNDVLNGGDGDDILVGFTASNDIKQTLAAGETDNDTLYGGTGADQMYGGFGDDILDGGNGSDILGGGDGTDTLFGGAGDDELNGGNGNDTLVGEAGADKIFGGVGNDAIWGGDGDDILMGFTASNDAKQTLASGETDDDMLFGGAGNDLILGGLGNDVLYGETGNDELQGGVGNDQAYGGDGNDRLFGQVGDDILYGGAGDDLLVGFTGTNEAKQTLSAGETDNDWLYGGDGKDTLLGGLGNDYLDGGAGADNMQGGRGDDTYIVNSVNDVILEYANDGYDTVISSSNTVLNANIEELRLVEGFNINGTGNGLANRIVGNIADNILDGVTGADTMIGGKGNDTYYVDNIGDVVTELSNEGTDTVQSKISYTLGDNVDNLNLLDFGKAERGLVDGTAVLVYGYPKANELDYMQGDAVPNYKGTCALTSIANLLTQAKTPTTESQVVQLAINNKWAVTSASATDYQRGGSNFQQQQRILDSYGIANNLLTGYNEQAVANLIKSGRGVILALNAGKLWGDAAYVDGGGVNHVVTLTGAVYGETDGALKGFYVADSGRQLVSDMTRYVSLADFRAAANVSNAYAIYTTEALKLWSEDIGGTGNALANTIIGNRGNNVLDGGLGNDILAGGLGNDSYRFGRGYGADLVQENDGTVGNTDVAQFLAGISTDQIWLRHVGNNLEASIIGTTDKLTLENWYSGAAYHVEQFKTAGNKVLLDSRVENLVQAMAAFAPPAAGQTTLPPAYQTALAPVLAANWQ